MAEITLNGHQIRVKGKVQERQVNPWSARISSGPIDFGSFNPCQVREFNDFRGGLGIETESAPSDRYWWGLDLQLNTKSYMSLGPLKIDSAQTFKGLGKMFCDFEGSIFMFGNGVSAYKDVDGQWEIADGAPLVNPTDCLTIRDTTDNYMVVCNGSDIRYTTSGYDNDPTELYAGELTWTRSADAIDVTCTADPTIKYTGSYSAKMACTSTLGVENIAYYNTGTLDISNKKYVVMWVYSSVALVAGDLQLILATNTALGGTVEAENIPAVEPERWVRVVVPITTPGSFSSLDSIGIKQAVDKGAFDLYIDQIEAITTAGWATLSTSDVKYMAIFDRRLVGVTADGGTLFSSAQGNIDDAAGGAISNSFTMTGPWTIVFDLFSGLLPNSSTEVIFMLTDKGLVYIDYSTQSAELMDVMMTNFYSSIGTGLYYNGEIYVSCGAGIKKISSTGIVTEWGPDQDDGMDASFQGYVYDMVPSPNWIFILLQGTGGSGWGMGSGLNYSILKRHNTLGGWHLVTRTASADAWPSKLHYTTLSSPARLYFSKDAASIYYPISYFEVLDTTSNVKQSQSYYSSYKFASSGTLYTPVYKPVEGIPKIAVSMEAITTGCTATETITVYYRLNNSIGDWTSLGSFTTSPYPAELSFGSGAGAAFYAIQFKIVFARGSTTTLTPIIHSLKFNYIVNPSYVGGWTFDVNAEGQNAKEVVGWITTARDAGTLVMFSPVGNINQESYYVKVQQCPSKYEALDPSGDRALTVTVAEAK